MQHLHHENEESGWSKKKGEELIEVNGWSGHKFNYFDQVKGMIYIMIDA